MIYIYHYYATCYNETGIGGIHLDGVLERNEPVNSRKEYLSVRDHLLAKLKKPNENDIYEITIKTLYLLGALE